MLKNKLALIIGMMGALAFMGCATDDNDTGDKTQTQPTEPGTPNPDDPGTPNPDDPGTQNPPVASAVCGNGMCENGESTEQCPNDCRPSPGNTAKDKCGDGVCDILENYISCPDDCKSECGNGHCESGQGEDVLTCPNDCSVCGDGHCTGKENKDTCPYDCGFKFYCGDGTCNSGETRLNCADDCPPVCGDDICEKDHETVADCPQDCAEPDVEYVSVCGDGVCDDDEKESCAEDCNSEVTASQLSMEAFNGLKENKFRFLYDYDVASTPLARKTSEMDDKEFAAQLSNFFSFPYPSDVRTDAYGRAKFANYPMPPIAILDNPLVSGIVGAVLPKLKGLLDSLVTRVETERKGFSPIGGVYFRASVLLDTKPFPKPAETTSDNSCFQLINVEPDSKYYGERVPLYVSFHRSANKVWADNTLVLRPVPGVGAHPGDRYVAIVGDCLTSNGSALKQSNKLRQILNGTAPKEIQDKQSFYVEQLKSLEASNKLGMKIQDIRAMTGYYVMNPADEMDQMARDLEGKGYIVADENGVAVGEYETKTTSGWSTKGFNSYIFKGKFVTANYINGQYPYTSATGDPKRPVGEMTFDENGKLVSERQEETIEYRIIIPRTPMPEKGYPIVLYGHGTGGGSNSHCRYWGDEGIALINGGWNKSGSAAPGKNAVPAAMIGFDASLHGSRAGGAEFGDFDMYMMMFNEPIVIRESWRQTVLDMLVIYDILDRGELILPPLPDSTDDRNVIFDPSYGMYMGHSQGAQEAGLLLGLTGKIKNAFLSAGGGGILLSFVDLYPDLSGLDPKVKAIIGDRSVADIVGLLLGLQDGDISYDTFLTNHLIQPLVDPIDPLNYTTRFIKDPPKGWPSKNIVQSIGIGDRSTPNAAQFAMIASEGLPAIGKVFNYSDPMELLNLHETSGNSDSDNVKGGNNTVTAGALQFTYTGDDNPHFVIYHMESARDSYINFFKSVLDGKPTVSVSGKQESDK